MAVLLDYKATMFSEWWAVPLLRRDTLLFARQSWLSCKAATPHSTSRLREPLQKENALPSWLGEWERRPQPKGGGQRREAGRRARGINEGWMAEVLEERRQTSQKYFPFSSLHTSPRCRRKKNLVNDTPAFLSPLSSPLVWLSET